MKTQIACLVLSILGGMGPLFAQKNTVKLDVKLALEKSILASKQLHISEQKLAQAEAQWQQAKNNRLPDLTVSGQYLLVQQPQIKLDIPASAAMASGTIAPNRAMFANLSTSLPIFAGGKISKGIKAAEYLKKAVELQGKNLQAELAENTVGAYYNLLKAQKAVGLLKEMMHQAEQRVADFQHMEKNGLLARNDLMKVQLQKSHIELTLLEAQNNVRVATYSFDLMLGLDTDTELLLDSSIVYTEGAQKLNDYIDQATQNRNDYLALEAQGDATKQHIKIARGSYYPSIALTGSYVNLKVPSLLTVTNALTGGIGLNYNIANLYKNSAKVNEAQSLLQQVILQKEALSDQIKTEIFKAFQDALVQSQKIKVYQDAVSQADENCRVTKNKYDNGLSTTTELLDAENAKLQAHLDLMYASADKSVAIFHLQKVSGQIKL